MSKFPVVSSFEDYEAVLSDLREVMNLSTRLPDFSFFLDEGTDSFCEFEYFRASSFGPFLKALAAQFRDAFVLGASIEPPSYVGYEDYNGTFAAFNVPASQVAERYGQALEYEQDGNIADAMMYAADVLCVTGSSRSWAIWGERPIGVAIIRTTGSDVSWRKDSDWFLSPTDAIHAFIEPNFNRKPLSVNFRRTFLQNVRAIQPHEV
jgi:hypothetical protein